MKMKEKQPRRSPRQKWEKRLGIMTHIKTAHGMEF